MQFKVHITHVSPLRTGISNNGAEWKSVDVELALADSSVTESIVTQAYGTMAEQLAQLDKERQEKNLNAIPGPWLAKVEMRVHNYLDRNGVQRYSNDFALLSITADAPM